MEIGSIYQSASPLTSRSRYKATLISLYLLIRLLGSADQKTSQADWRRGTQLSLGPRNMAYLVFFLWHDFVLQVCCGYRSVEPRIRQALSLSPRYICTINKGEGLRPVSCFDFIIYILFILCPPTHNHFLLEWQDLY